MSALVLLLVGCRKNEEYISQNFNTNEYRDYMLEEEQLTSLNYLVSSNPNDTRVIANLIDGLVENDQYGRIVPALSQITGHHDQSQTLWQFYLKGDLFWADSSGSLTDYAITADDFVFSIEYILDPANQSDYVSLITSTIIGAEEYYQAKKNGQSPDFSIVGVRAMSPSLVEYELIEAIPHFNSYLTSAAFYPLSRDYYYTLENGVFATNKDLMLYNGAYHLSLLNEKGLTLEKNNLYWDEASVNFKSIRFDVLKDEEEALRQYKNGRLSIVHLSKELGDKHPELNNYMYASSKNNTSYAFVYNFISNSSDFQTAIKNEDFRKALLYGFERNVIVPTTVPSLHQSIATIIPEYYLLDSNNNEYTRFGSISEFERPSLYNSTTAKKYFDNAKETLKTEVSFPIKIRVPVSEYNEMEKGLVDRLNLAFSNSLGNSAVVFVAVEYATSETIYQELLLDNDFDMILIGLDVEARDPYYYLSQFSSDGYINLIYSNFSDSIFDNFIKAADTINDFDNRYYAFNECEAYLIQMGYVLPYSTGKQVYQLSMINDFSKPISSFGIAHQKIKNYEVIGHSVSLEELNKNLSVFESNLKELNH